MHPDRMKRLFGDDWKPDEKQSQSEQEDILEMDYPINNIGLFNGDNEITNNK